MYRSTKGASKARRDQINAEIRNLKDLLPIPEGDKLRLSYLHIMSLACLYTRKSVFFPKGAAAWEALGSLLSGQDLEDFVQTLPGFLLAFTGEGKLIYVSENVAEHLGHSMVDLVAQGDSIYDIIDPVDHFVMRHQLALPSPADPHRLFRCRFNTSKTIRRQSAGNKLVLIRGRFHQPPPGSYWATKPIFMAFCTPLDPKPRASPNSFFLSSFESHHTKDLAIVDIADSVVFHLGFEKTELFCKSWYSLIHPEDLGHASAQHCRLLGDTSETQAEMVIRLQTKGGLSWIWVYSLLRVENAEVPIAGHNYIISDSEAGCLKQQLSAEETQVATYVLGSSPPFLEGFLSPGQLSSPDQVFSPLVGTPASSAAAPAFDFGATAALDCPSGFAETSAAGLPPEVMAEPGNISSMEEAPGSSLGLLGKGPAFSYVVFPTSYEPPVRRDPPDGSSRDLVCTPPYTPHQGSAFLFGAQEAHALSTVPRASPPVAVAASAPSSASASATATVPSAATTTTSTTTTTSELFYAQEQCSALYEKLPPTPDSPGNGDCTVMTLPEIRGPLYIDVPMVPEGILTPEASPIKQTFFRYSEREKSEIERLAQQISCLAEAFSSVASRELAEGSQASLGGSGPVAVPDVCLDFQPPRKWRKMDFSLLACPEEGLLGKDALETLLQDLSSSLFEKGGAGMRCPRHQFCGGNVSSPLHLDAEDSSQAALAPSPHMDLPPEERCFLEELASCETAFETRASNSPCDGLDELYQLQSHMQDGFHEDGSESDPSF
ncbi:neuronal PAS domain-containing protein 4 [Hemicordylus capensis]|uniref:neuronal PAS domain-containing protein 4 n=1 Tax=Hemicordylus capensis TaxID=884348 RepID=UPI0023037750|nr:neuronal PAS domain-containing protein 4 [Hemicordylus capensis]